MSGFELQTQGNTQRLDVAPLNLLDIAGNRFGPPVELVQIPTNIAGHRADVQHRTILRADSDLVRQYREAKESVAKIEATKPVYMNGRAIDTQPSQGSGFVLTMDGRIATKWHVVKDATDIIVTVNNRRYQATIEAADPKTDLAILKIDDTRGQFFRPLMLASSLSLQANDRVVALGHTLDSNQVFMSPGGYAFAPGGFLRRSRLSDIRRRMDESSSEDPGRTLLESKLLVGSGNSGGPLLNERFQVVGVVGKSNHLDRVAATPSEDLLRLLNETQRRDSGRMPIQARIAGGLNWTIAPSNPELRTFDQLVRHYGR